MKSFFIAAGLLFVVAVSHLSAQTAAVTPTAAPLRFEVTSVRPHPFAGDEPSDRRMEPGGRFVATATNVRTLLRIAFGIDDVNMTGVPGWVDGKLFDISATTAGRVDVRTTEQFQQLILSLLVDRFGLKYHREQKTAPVYWLELEKPGKIGPGLKPSAPDAVQNMSNSGGARAQMTVAKATMKDVAAMLRRQAGRAVEDHTGLTGEYDFHIEWAPDESVDPNDPSLSTVLKEQLGLKLVSAKGSVDVIAIDHIEQPAEN